MQARYVILQVLLEAGENLVNIKKTEDEDGKGNLLIQLDKDKIQTVGKDAIGKFLQKLQASNSVRGFVKGVTLPLRRDASGYTSLQERGSR